MTILIPLCILLLIAYIFDLTAARTKIPSVLLLLLLGWGVRQLTDYLDFKLAYISPLLPVLGTIGLILIVLEGALELELEASKKKMITKSVLLAVLPMVALALGMSWWLHFAYGIAWKTALTNAIPFCVVSSAIAIPSAVSMSAEKREFVIYESSVSDILGVLLFNFIAMNQYINGASLGRFGLEVVAMAVISFAATLGLAFMLRKIQHPIKFMPIILMIILIYAAAKEYHLPALLFILLFGLFLGNLDELKNIKWIRKLHPERLDEEVRKFQELTTEGAFLIRALFFLVFGFLMETSKIIDLHTLPSALFLALGIYAGRALFLKILKQPLFPLLFLAPRGLITILLFYSVAKTERIPLLNQSLVIQVILLTVLIMMVGLFFENKKSTTQPIEELPGALPAEVEVFEKDTD